MIRMEISPSKEESNGWTLEDWKQLAEDFVQVFDRIRLPGEEKLRRSPCRLPNSQYIITLHTDSKSGIPHLHLDCNRVDMANCLNSDHRIGVRAMMAAEEVRQHFSEILPSLHRLRRIRHHLRTKLRRWRRRRFFLESFVWTISYKSVTLCEQVPMHMIRQS